MLALCVMTISGRARYRYVLVHTLEANEANFSFVEEFVPIVRSDRSVTIAAVWDGRFIELTNHEFRVRTWRADAVCSRYG